jgi:hypothetical protein
MYESIGTSLELLPSYKAVQTELMWQRGVYAQQSIMIDAVFDLAGMHILVAGLGNIPYPSTRHRSA